MGLGLDFISNSSLQGNAKDWKKMINNYSSALHNNSTIHYIKLIPDFYWHLLNPSLSHLEPLSKTQILLILDSNELI